VLAKSRTGLNEAVIDAMQERLDRSPKSMHIRRATVEHPFGTIKAWMGATHFLTKTLEKVSTEMSFHVLAYNLKRVISILGHPEGAGFHRYRGAVAVRMLQRAW
jgi:hypothetical protein